SNPQYPPTQFAGNPPMQFGSNPQYTSTQYAMSPNQFGSNPSFPPAWQIPMSSMPQQSQPYSTQSAPALPPNAVQRSLIRLFSANLASNALFGVILGSLLTAVGGVLVTGLLVSIAHAMAPQVTNPGGSNGYASGENSIDFALGIVQLYSLFRDSLQLFLVMQGVGIHIQYSTGAYASFAPLHGLLVLPALLLTLAGYIAASTDFHNRLQSSLWRGVAIALPYTLLLWLMTTQVNGCIPANGPGSSAVVCSVAASSSSGTLSMDTL